MVVFYFPLILRPCTKQTIRSVARQSRPVGQRESFMGWRLESGRGNGFRPQRGQTLTQSLALQQEGSGHLETAPKDERNHIVEGHSCRKRLKQSSVTRSISPSWSSCLFNAEEVLIRRDFAQYFVIVFYQHVTAGDIEVFSVFFAGATQSSDAIL